MVHRWSTGSRTCDNCGRDYDWAEEPCLEPIKDDLRRLPIATYEPLKAKPCEPEEG